MSNRNDATIPTVTNLRSSIIDSWKARDITWAQQARAWVLTKLREIITAYPGPHTAADLMQLLDVQSDAPPGYVRHCVPTATGYVARYTWVRNAANKLAREGVLISNTAATTNSKGKPATTYTLASVKVTAPAADTAHSWDIDISGGPRARKARESLQEWLDTNSASLGDLDGLLITRLQANPRGTQEDMPVIRNTPSEEPTLPAMRRNRGTRPPRR